MTLPLTHENYERLRESAIDPRSPDGKAELEAQARFLVSDLVMVRSQSGDMPDDTILRAIVEPRVDTIRNMLYPMDSFASPILRAHKEFKPEKLDTDVTVRLERDKRRADQYSTRSNVIAAIALRQAMHALPGHDVNPSQIIDNPIDLDSKVKADYGPRWTTARLATLYDTNPYLVLDRSQQETIALRASRHYYALPVVAFGYKALHRARRSMHRSEPEHQSAA